MKIFGKDKIDVNVKYDPDALDRFDILQVKDNQLYDKLIEINNELKEMNMHLELITDEEIKDDNS